MQVEQPPRQNIVFEETTFDNEKQRSNTNLPIGSNTFSSIMALVNFNLSVTLLYLPKFFVKCGVLLGTLMLLSFAILNFIGTTILVQASRKLQLNSYFEIGSKIFRPSLRYIFDFFYVAILLGNIITSQVFVIQSFDSFISGHLTQTWQKYSHINIYISILVTLFSCFVILPFILKTSIKFIKITSKVSNISIICAFVILVLCFYMPDLFDIEIKPIDSYKIIYWNTDGLYEAFGFYMLGFCQQLIVVELYNVLRPKTRYNKWNVLISGNFLTFLFYFLFSLIGYLVVYQTSTKDLDNIFIFLSNEKRFFSVLMLICNMFVTVGILLGIVSSYFPLVNYFNYKLNKQDKNVSLSLIEDLDLNIDPLEYELTDEHMEKRQQKKQSKIIFCIFSFVLFVLVIFAIFDLTVFAIFDVVSAITIPVTCFIFPFFIYFRLLRNNYIQRYRIFHYIACFTLIFIGFGIWIFSIMALYYVKFSNNN